MNGLSSIWSAIERVARDNGVLRVGASNVGDAHVAVFHEWLDHGHHATMQYLAKNRAIRTNPHERFPWAKSAIVILVPYAPERPAADPGALSHHVARYALGDDYHDVLDGILRAMEAVFPAGTKTWRYVDTGPLSDRSLAAQAGLGWIGRNGMLIDEEHGSYFFIGVLLTSLENDIAASEVADRCGACTRCIDACPTDAILPNRTVASEHCISYGTIEHRGPLEARIGEALTGNAFGCDICQEVCPWNAAAPKASDPAWQPRPIWDLRTVPELERLSDDEVGAGLRGSPMKRTKAEGLRRNLACARQNAPGD